MQPNQMAVTPLFSLPDELRARIWELVVVSDKPIKVQRRNGRGLATFLKTEGREDRQLFSSNLNIAFVCRRLWQEITPLYYSHNKFNLDPPKTIPDFIKAIGPSNARAITKIETDICLLWTASFLDKLLPGLTSIEIGCLAHDSSQSPKSAASRESHATHIISIVCCYPSIILTYQGMALHGEQCLHRIPRTR